MKEIRILVILVVLTALSTPASALLLIDAGANSTEQNFASGNYVAGTEFTTQSEILVDGLGYIDINSDGFFGESHRIGLWDSTGTLLAEATATDSSTVVASASSLGQWLVEALTNPILLGPGVYRVAGIVGPESLDSIGANALSNDKIGNGVTLTNGYHRTNFPNGGFGDPNQNFSSQAIRATLTTGQFAPTTPMPVPATLLLMCLGLAAAVGTRKRV